MNNNCPYPSRYDPQDKNYRLDSLLINSAAYRLPSNQSLYLFRCGNNRQILLLDSSDQARKSHAGAPAYARLLGENNIESFSGHCIHECRTLRITVDLMTQKQKKNYSEFLKYCFYKKASII